MEPLGAKNRGEPPAALHTAHDGLPDPLAGLKRQLTAASSAPLLPDETLYTW
jgi:hypothetical protein